MSDSKNLSGDDEPKAKHILSEFKGRLTMIERMNARLRPLRPPVCTSRRLFDYFELPDPYHPIDFNKPYKPDVGPSKLVLGENRRPVAPHAKVPELSSRIGDSKPKAPQAFRPQGIPSAPTRDTNRRPEPPKPTKSQAELVAKKPNQKPEFGNSNSHALKKLPVRPDLAQQSSDTISSKSSKAEQPAIQRSIPRPKPQPTKSRSGNMRMRRSTISNTKPVVKSMNPQPSSPTTNPTVEPSSPLVKPNAVNRSPSAATGGGLDDLFGFGNQEGRMKIPRVAKKSKPSLTQVNPNAVASNPNLTEAKSVEPKRELPKIPPKSSTSSINRSPSAASGSGGLDDLFGFGNQEGRMKIPRAPKRNEGASKSKAIFDKNPIQKPTDTKK
jgi:hypothetical protein